jgi:hypothetical protein
VVTGTTGGFLRRYLTVVFDRFVFLDPNLKTPTTKRGLNLVQLNSPYGPAGAAAQRRRHEQPQGLRAQHQRHHHRGAVNRGDTSVASGAAHAAPLALRFPVTAGSDGNPLWRAGLRVL